MAPDRSSGICPHPHSRPRPRRVWRQLAPLGGALALAASLLLLIPARTPGPGLPALDYEVTLGSGELDNAAALQLVVELLEASPPQRAAFRAALEAAEDRRPETTGELVRSSEGLPPSRRSLES